MAGNAPGVVIEKTEWGGWPNCYRLSNGEVDMIVTGDIGPRVMRYGFTAVRIFSGSSKISWENRASRHGKCAAGTASGQRRRISSAPMRRTTVRWRSKSAAIR